MGKSKNNFREVLLTLALLALVLFLAVLLEGLFVSDETPWEAEKMEVIDSYSVADSSIDLVRLRERHMGFQEGTYFFLTYRKNWITGRRENTRLAALYEEPYYTAVVTPLAEYAVTVTQEKILVGEVKKGLQWGEFCRVYGIGAMSMLTALAGYYVGKFKNKKS